MSSSLAADIAAAAARLVVDEGMEYAGAKRKAARQLGRGHARAGELPGNEQVEDEVRAHLQLFCAEQPAELAALRRLALQWMERLAEFRPHLAGAVWRGTATRLSAIHLELYCDDTKAAEIGLINQGLDYDVGSRNDPRGGNVDVLTIASPSPDVAVLGAQPVTIHLSVLDHDDLRGALKPDARGRSWRGDAVALRRLIEAQAAP